jgi:hypothetical protein
MSEDAEQLKSWRSDNAVMPRIIGTASELADVMGRYAEVGVDEFVVSDLTLGRDAGEKRDNMERFLDAVAIHMQDRSGS